VPEAAGSNGDGLPLQIGTADSRIVQFDNVSKSYDGQTMVVKDLCLEVRRGEFLTFLGPSGSGKTTTLMMLAGFDDPTKGEIRLNGRSLKNVSPEKRNLGMVFQNYALCPHMTVAENVGYSLRVRRVSKVEAAQRVLRILDMVKLRPFADRKPSQLSGGQQQRVAIARALVFNPELILLDEPLGALDKQLREHMKLEIRHLHSSLGTTMVYVTHDQSEALAMSDRIAIFNHGSIQQLADPATLYDSPSNTFVASFVGENNMLPGIIEQVSGGFCTVRIGDDLRVLAGVANVEGVGSRTTVSIRPERVVLGPSDDRLPNRFSARVMELIYLGASTSVRLAIAGSQDFYAHVKAGAGPCPAPGDEVAVGWSAEACCALDPLEAPRRAGDGA
jgi:putative spermidine/putrescine transport system ATP-binding protein